VRLIVVLFGALWVLEYLFWLSPIKPFIDKLLFKGTVFFVFPLHYWIRICLTSVIVFSFNPGLHNSFGNFATWVHSLLLGLAICGGSLAGFNVRLSRLGAAVRSSASTRFWIHSVYILVYPSLVEELLCRWLLVWMLLPQIGWWVVLIAPAINILWHLPVWVESVMIDRTVPWNRVWSMSMPAFVFAVLLTVGYVLTKNIIGVIVAHAFGDWVNIAIQY